MSPRPVVHRRREPAPGVFRLVLPLPFEGLDRVNAYLLKGQDGHTLIDCGIYNLMADRDHGWVDLAEALAACDARIDDISRLVVTHPHIDHYGMAGRLVAESGCELWMHESSRAELDMFRHPDETISKMRQMLAAHVSSEDELDELVAFEDWRGFIHSVVEPTRSLQGEESLDVDGDVWQIVHTPGHSSAHVCVWDPNRRILISGDHLLPAITPHIDFKRWEDEDPLGDYLASLKKVEELEPELVLPGHGHPFDEGAERARAISSHHDRRLGSVLQVIRREPHTAEEITNAIFGETLLNFQKRLALGEALAHLAYLRRHGEVERTEHDGIYRYVKARRRPGNPKAED